ncbi:MAG: aminotransferase class V-fold PLP-dependent enzyme [Pyrinomonadaceae bacterium]
MINFDNNATTHMAAKVFDAMRTSSENAEERARESVAALLVAASADEIKFTRSGTDSCHQAIFAAINANPEKDHIITTRVEHDAVRQLCEKLEHDGKRVTWLDVDEDGSLDLDALRTSLDERTAVVSVMMANHETGILFPVAEIADIVKEQSDAVFHVDGASAVGKVPIDLKTTEIDLFSVSAHKFYGPKGIGALYISEGVDVPRTDLNAPADLFAGIGAAAELVRDLTPMKAVAEMRDHLENSILALVPDAFLNGTSDALKRLPNTSYISFANTNGEAILAMLNDAGVRVSTGSACNSQDHTPSAVLKAMNVPYARAMGSIRFSLGRNNTAAEVETVIEVLPGIIENLRKLGN